MSDAGRRRAAVRKRKLDKLWKASVVGLVAVTASACLYLLSAS